MRAHRLLLTLGCLAVSAASVPAPSAAFPYVTPRCPDVRATASPFFTGPAVASFDENLGFDGRGGLWVSQWYEDRIDRLGPDGRVLTSFPLKGPGAIRQGPDGLMYAIRGSDLLTYAGVFDAAVVRFDPDQPRPRPEVVVDGLPYGNGMDVAADGTLYVSNPLGRHIIRVRPGRPPELQWATILTPNGLEIVGDDLYVSRSYTPGGASVVRLRIDDPSDERAVSTPGRSFVTDDLTTGPDGRLYVAGFGSGSVYRVDPRTAETCLVWATDQRPVPSAVSSLRFADASFGSHAGDLFITTGEGVLRLELAPEGQAPRRSSNPLPVT